LWHIDGFASPENSVNPGEIRNFTMLVGIPLSRTDVEHCGNLVVYPGSHHVLQDYFRTAGFDKARQHGVRCLPELKLSSPVQICADMGDVVLLHYQLAHSIAPNCSPNIRYQLYYRVNVRPSDTFYPASMLDIWAEYPGMRDTEQSHAHQVEAHLKSLNPSLVRPAYVDGHARATQLEQSEQEQVFADMQNHAKALFERKQYLEAIPIYE
jgi:ectoine hydroxylase-related dioxygenase (phytanoyl-CoA dioxygenase family)